MMCIGVSSVVVTTQASDIPNNDIVECSSDDQPTTGTFVFVVLCLVLSCDIRLRVELNCS